MRYKDINPAFDPLIRNITTKQFHVIGVYAPESKIYIALNGGRRSSVNTDIGGLFEYDFDELHVGDIVTFSVKNGSDYETLLEEVIRE
ncbi:hypothetical protein [Listeria booriae]|uniref:Uncharacterized protein n=1 Tax=Listeria booriae TaxID=1552123 RepID=A0A842FY58_9LIST|nr:hypothetical protein [Listeria booriae]MBC2100635.1 hypothetical protein [Listeria booriae]MBC2293765.1 hypothetical protein [Listeria booriae]MBC2392205.1 hypothetical protein [Listeria booriae]